MSCQICAYWDGKWTAIGPLSNIYVYAEDVGNCCRSPSVIETANDYHCGEFFQNRNQGEIRAYLTRVNRFAAQHLERARKTEKKLKEARQKLQELKSKIPSVTGTKPKAEKRIIALMRAADMPKTPAALQTDPPKLPPANLPKVTVLGLTQPHQKWVIKEFSSIYDLSFFSGHQLTQPDLAKFVKNADAVLVMVRFLDKDEYPESLKLATITRKTVAVFGGLDALRNMLVGLYQNLGVSKEITLENASQLIESAAAK